MKIYLSLLTLLSQMTLMVPARAHIVLGLPAGSADPQSGAVIELPDTLGGLLKAVALNYRHRLSAQNFPSAAADRIWFGRDRKTLVVGRVRKFLIEARTTLVFRNESRAAAFKVLFESNPHQIIYLVYDSKNSNGVFFPKVKEENLWLGVRQYNTSMTKPLIRLSEFLNQNADCEAPLQAQR